MSVEILRVENEFVPKVKKYKQHCNPVQGRTGKKQGYPCNENRNPAIITGKKYEHREILYREWVCVVGTGPHKLYPYIFLTFMHP